MNRPFSKTLFACALMAAAPMASADLELSGNVAMTTDYVWRGVSQTGEDPAIQGGFDLAYGNFYIGTWGSNVDFGGDEHMELDVYAGVSGELDNGFGWDVGVIHYDYPGVSTSDFDEWYIGGSYGFFSLTYSNAFGSPDTGDYLDAGFEFELPQGIALALHAGKYDKPGNGDDYTDYSVGLSKEVGGFGLDLSYYNTSGWDAGNDISSGVNANDSRFVFTVSKSF
jgi:uncharacterized protein (TIGR02001 family)